MKTPAWVMQVSSTSLEAIVAYTVLADHRGLAELRHVFAVAEGFTIRVTVDALHIILQIAGGFAMGRRDDAQHGVRCWG